MAVAANYRTHHPDAWASYTQVMLATARGHPDRTVAVAAVQALADALAATPSSRSPVPPTGADPDPLLASAADWIQIATHDPPTSATGIWPIVRHLLGSPALDPEWIPSLFPCAQAHPVELAEAMLSSPATLARYTPGDPWWPAAVDSLVLPLLMAPDAHAGAWPGEVAAGRRASAGLDAAAAIPAEVFSELPRKQHVALVSMVVAKATTLAGGEVGDGQQADGLGVDRDAPVVEEDEGEQASVSAAACRAVGVFCGHPELSDVRLLFHFFPPLR